MSRPHFRLLPPRPRRRRSVWPRTVGTAVLNFCPHRSATAKAQAKYTCRQNVDRYRRLLKSSINKERREYLSRLILEEQQKQKDAGDSDYQY